MLIALILVGYMHAPLSKNMHEKLNIYSTGHIAMN